MKIQQISPFCFRGMPSNYSKIDKYLSRSAQPQKEDFSWLKEQGVTDVINFRTMFVEGVDYSEAVEVEKAGMIYHNIPSVTKKPKEENIMCFLSLVESIKNKGGKAHIHCKAGADRTGMYAFIYKAINKIGSLVENEKEWIARGHNVERYPELRNWTKNFLKTIK